MSNAKESFFVPLSSYTALDLLFAGLNTCIGKNNYQLFYRTMVSLFVMLTMHFIISIALVGSSANETGGTRQRMETWGNPNMAGSSVAALRAILIFFILFDFASLFLLGQLIYFHIGLQRKNLTTYEYIVQDMERKRERHRVEGERNSHRVRQVNKAKREGRHMYATRLIVGGYCRNDLGCAACDPLEMPPVESKGSAEQAFSMALGTGAVMDDDESDGADGQVRESNGVTFVQVNENGNDGQPEPAVVPAAEPRLLSHVSNEGAAKALQETVQSSESPLDQHGSSNQRKASQAADDAPSDEDSLLQG